MEFSINAIVNWNLAAGLIALFFMWRQARSEKLEAEAKKLEAEAKKLEAEAKKLEAEATAMRASFKKKVDTFCTLDEIIKYIQTAEFPEGATGVNSSSHGTAEYVSDSSSAVSYEGKINLSKFQRKDLSGAVPEQCMAVFESQLDRCAIREVVLEELFMNRVEDFDEFLKEGVDILQKLRNVLQWHLNENDAVGETKFQIIFQLFLQGIIAKSPLRLEVFPINRAELKCKVLFNGRKEACLSGFSDVGVGRVWTEKLCVDDKIVELKPFGGKMTQRASLNRARDQMLGQLYTLQSTRSGGYQRSQGFLTDLSRIMIAFGCKREKSGHVFVISSTIQDPADYICHLMFVLMDRDMSKRDIIFDPRFKQPLPVDDEEAEEAPEGDLDGQYLMPTSLLMPENQQRTRSSTRTTGKAGHQREMRVFDLNADDREDAREQKLRYIYAHDAFRQGYGYLNKENLLQTAVH